jgi:RNA ligase (TIGR02306 family)
MSKLIVEIVIVKEIKPHANADALEISVVKGWQVVVKKGTLQPGDTVVYFPPDCILPQQLSDKLGVTQYLSKDRVRTVKLRGEVSHGFIVARQDIPELNNNQLGDNVADLLNITKWEPPQELYPGEVLPDLPYFLKYTDIENFRNFPDVMTDDEPVVITEKIHGTNCRVGFVSGEYVAGSHKLRIKEPDDKKYETNMYWYPYSLAGVKDLLAYLCEKHGSESIILFGEVYGWVQDLKYGRTKGKVAFAAFDISIQGKYLNWAEFKELCTKFNIPMVPVLKQDAFGNVRQILDTLISGKTDIKTEEGRDIDQVKEGIVIRLVTERTDAKIGRVILKYINDDYLTRHTDKTEYH